MNDQPNPCWGSTLDDFLKEEGIYEAAKTTAVLRVVAWQLTQEMKRQGLSKTELAARMHTSRAQPSKLCNAPPRWSGASCTSSCSSRLSGYRSPVSDGEAALARSLILGTGRPEIDQQPLPVAERGSAQQVHPQPLNQAAVGGRQGGGQERWPARIDIPKQLAA